MEDVKDHTVEQIENKLKEMNTGLNKISYLEKIIREKSFTLEVKRYILGQLTKFYEEQKMYMKAARAMINKAGIEILAKDKIDSYLFAAELYAKLGDVDEADQIFNVALRNTSPSQRTQIMLAKKNIFLQFANQLDKQGKKASAIKFFEKLIKMELDPIEKEDIKSRLKARYTSLGLFREAKFL